MQISLDSRIRFSIALIVLMTLKVSGAAADERLGFVIGSAGSLNHLGIAFKSPGGQSVLDVLHSGNHMVAARAEKCFSDVIMDKEDLIPRNAIYISEIDLRAELDSSSAASFAGDIRLLRKKVYETTSAIQEFVDPYDSIASFRTTPDLRCTGAKKITVQRVFWITGIYEEEYDLLVSGEIDFDLGKKIKSLLGKWIPDRVLESIDFDAALKGGFRELKVDGFEINNPTRIAFEPLRISRQDLQRKLGWLKNFGSIAKVSSDKDTRNISINFGSQEDLCRLIKKYGIREELIAFNDSFGLGMNEDNSVIFDPSKKDHHVYAQIIHHMSGAELMCRVTHAK